MRPLERTQLEALYECFDCGWRDRTAKSGRCEDCGGVVRNIGQIRDL